MGNNKHQPSESFETNFVVLVQVYQIVTAVFMILEVFGLHSRECPGE